MDTIGWRFHSFILLRWNEIIKIVFKEIFTVIFIQDLYNFKQKGLSLLSKDLWAKIRNVIIILNMISAL
jgi:hypothetical protein